ncbi:MAG: PqqD family protein [Clostridia bacterium]|nr:PqqD family protein [Clostridia bacterium]
MKIKEGYLLRKAAQENIVLYIGDEDTELNGMIRLNDAGAVLWKLMAEGKTRPEIVTSMLDMYSGLDEETAKRDLDEFIETVKVALADDQ